LTIILGGKLAICCLHGQAEDQINFLSNDLPGETKVILFLKLAHEHFEIVQMNGHSLFVFDNLNSTLAKGQSAHVPDPSMNSRQISQQVNAGQGHIDRFFKPKAETERSQQINEGKRIFQPFQKQNLQLKALSPEIARAGAFIERMEGIGALQVLKEMAPNVSRLLTAQIRSRSEPFLTQQTVRSFVGMSDITRRLHALVCNLHSEAAIHRNQAFVASSAGLQSKYPDSTGARKIAYYANKAGLLSSTLAGVLEKHDPVKFETFLIWSGDEENLNPAQNDLIAHFKSQGHLLCFETDIPKIMELRLDALVDISNSPKSDHLAMKLASVVFKVSEHGEFQHYHGDLLDFSIGGESAFESGVNQTLPEQSIKIPGWLPIPNHDYYSGVLNMTRTDFGLPPESFLICFPSRPETVTSEKMCLWLRLLYILGSHSSLVLIPSTNGPMEPLNIALRHAEADGYKIDKNRILIRPMENHGSEFIALLRQVDLFVGSSHGRLTSVARKPVLVLIHEDSDLENLAACEHMKAIGLGSFVTNKVEEFFEKGQQLAKKKQLLNQIAGHIEQVQKLGGENWTKDVLEKALLCGIDQVCKGQERKPIRIEASLSFQEFQDSDEITQNVILANILKKKKLDQCQQAAVLSVMREVQQTGNTVDDFAGIGGSTLTLLCRQTANGNKAFAIKIDFGGVKVDRMLDSGCFRAAFNSELTEKDRRDQTRRNLIPINIDIFNNQSAFCGHTAPDSSNRAHFFYCCEFADCQSFALRCRHFQEAWRDTGTFTEEFRCFVLRFLETIDLLHGQNLSILDVKFDNLGFDKDGNPLVTDLGFSVSFSFKLGGDSFARRSAPEVACPRISKSRAYPRNCLVGQRNRSDAGTVFFSKDELGNCRDALLRHPEHGGKLWCLGIGTRTYYDESSSGLRQSKENVISKSKAFADDTFQAAMFMIRIFRPPKPGEDNYYNIVSEASSSLEKMKKFLTPGNIDVQQDAVFTRWATLFCIALGPDRASLKSIINSDAMLLLVLEPEFDRLAHGDGIRFDGGFVRDMNCVAKHNEDWKDLFVFPMLLKYEDDKGLGIESVNVIPAKEFIGFMVGICVEEKSDMKKRNSKYAVAIFSADKRSPRCYLDAQPSEELTMDWFMTNNVYSHFINAGGKKEANCRLARREFWKHKSDDKTMILMPMYALSKNIQPGEKLCWFYDPYQLASST